MTMTAAHLWTLQVATIDPPTLESLTDILSQGERERAARFRFERDRRAFVAAHGLVRRALSRSSPSVHPHEWRFAGTAIDRPEVFGPAPGALPHFNLSRTAEVVACIVSAEAACGVDVQAMPPSLDLQLLSRDVLTRAERAELATLGPDQQRERFLRLWTLKEAYSKARGLGTSLPFNRVAFRWQDGAIRLEPRPTEPWTFAQWPTEPAHILSVAVHSAAVRWIRHVGLDCHTAA
jgi:4'-phosphopantetheinyl transferase